jgi:hypothetical protein
MFEIEIQRPTRRSRAFPVSIQIMVALRFFATGSFQAVNGDIHNISQSSVSKITKDVTQCLVSICRQYIVMPTDPAELQGIRILEKPSIFLLASVSLFQTFCTCLVSAVWIICISGLCHDHPNSPSVSKITKDVTQCLVSICRQYIVMPTDPAELQGIMQGFYNIANFPNAIK